MTVQFDRGERRRWTVLAAVMLVVLAALIVQTVAGSSDTGAVIVARLADDVVVVIAVLLCLLRAAAEPRGSRAPWLLLGGALLAWSFGTIFQSVAGWNRTVTEATVGDLGWLALYPLSGLAFLALARAQVGRLDLRLAIDVVITASALVAFTAGDLRETVASSGHSLGAWVSVCYAVGDLILAAIAIAIGSATRWQLDDLWLVLLSGFMVTMIGDRLYLEGIAIGRFDQAAVVAGVWSCGAALIGLSSGVALPLEHHDRRLAGAIGLPVVLAFGAVAIVVYSSFAPVDPLTVLLAAGSLFAVLVRLTLTHRDNRILLDQADRHAHVDPLTGLGNRRGLARDLRVMTETGSSPAKLELTLFDLDGFKSYNDRHGHLAGDELLALVSSRMRAAAADAGRCYRLGGDEFCLLVPVVDGRADAVTRETAAALSGDGVGCSFGTVTMGPETPLADALNLADQRMYAHKRDRQKLAGGEGAVVTHLDTSGDRRAGGHRRGARPTADIPARGGAGRGADDHEMARTAP